MNSTPGIEKSFMMMLGIAIGMGLLMFGGAIEAARIVTGRGVW